MGDLDIRFSGENDNKDLNSSLNLVLKNGQFKEVGPETPKPSVDEVLQEEYYQNLLDVTPEQPSEEETEYSELPEESFDEPEEEVFFEEPLREEIPREAEEEYEAFEEYQEDAFEEDFENFDEEYDTDAESDEYEEEFEEYEGEELSDVEAFEEEEEISEDEVAEDVEEPEENSEEISEAEESEDIAEEATEEEDTEQQAEAEAVMEEPTDWYEKALVTGANEVDDSLSSSDEKLGELSFDTQKGKYDFINLCVLALMLIFVSLTFILMKQTLVNDKKVELSFETIKTGEYTKDISEKYVKNLPLPKLMAQAEVLVKKIFGDSEAEFIKFNDSEPPDGPVDNDNIGGMTVDDEETVVTTVSGSVTQATTTGKLPQDFEITTSEVKTDDAPVFTGRPIKTTTTKVTTTLDLPKTTKDTTTGKVNLIFP